MGCLTGGAFLVAFAVLLGASTLEIGVIASIGPLTQILHLPASLIVEKLRTRKRLVIFSSLISRLCLLCLCAIPLFDPQYRVFLLLLCLFFYFCFGAISGSAFNSWWSDFVPQNRLSSLFANRLIAATGAGIMVTLSGAFWIDYSLGLNYQREFSYTILFFIGALFGLIGLVCLSRVPEPKMESLCETSLFNILKHPFQQENFRNLIYFLTTWNFAVNLAAPFFAVYMMNRLHLSMIWILSLAVLSQLVNILFFRLWGRLADIYSNKSVLGVSGWLFLLSIALWPFTTLPEAHSLTLPLLIMIHLLAGASTAGVILTSGNIAIKLAPRGQATAWIASSTMCNGIAATCAPIIAGFGARALEEQHFSLVIKWSSSKQGTLASLGAIDLSGLDFLFAAAFLLGLFALHRLLAVKEEGSVDEKIVLSEFYSGVRKAVRHISNVGGLRHLTTFPWGRLREIKPGSGDPFIEKKSAPEDPKPDHIGF